MRANEFHDLQDPAQAELLRAAYDHMASLNLPQLLPLSRVAILGEDYKSWIRERHEVSDSALSVYLPPPQDEVLSFLAGDPKDPTARASVSAQCAVVHGLAHATFYTHESNFVGEVVAGAAEHSLLRYLQRTGRWLEVNDQDRLLPLDSFQGVNEAGEEEISTGLMAFRSMCRALARQGLNSDSLLRLADPRAAILSALESLGPDLPEQARTTQGTAEDVRWLSLKIIRREEQAQLASEMQDYVV